MSNRGNSVIAPRGRDKRGAFAFPSQRNPGLAEQFGLLPTAYCNSVPNGQLPEPSFRKFVMPVASSSIANDIKKYSTFLERELKTDYSRNTTGVAISTKYYESPLDGSEKKLAFFFGRSVKDHPPT